MKRGRRDVDFPYSLYTSTPWIGRKLLSTNPGNVLQELFETSEPLKRQVAQDDRVSDCLNHSNVGLVDPPLAVKLVIEYDSSFKIARGTFYGVVDDELLLASYQRIGKVARAHKPEIAILDFS